MAKPGYVINPATGQEGYLQMPISSDTMRRFGSIRKKGISGYDPDFRDMRGTFMARGPGKYYSNQL